MQTCECADPGCPYCEGHCKNNGNFILYRIDMEDTSGTCFCEDCAEDAMESGVFTDITAEDWADLTANL